MIFRPGFFLLVFFNLVFFAWAGGYFGVTDEGREPQRVVQQLHPEKLLIVHEPGNSASPSVSSATPAATTEPAVAMPKTPAASPAR